MIRLLYDMTLVRIPATEEGCRPSACLPANWTGLLEGNTRHHPYRSQRKMKEEDGGGSISKRLIRFDQSRLTRLC